MACASSHSELVNRNGPGSAASSTIESIVNKPTGEGKTKCIECDGYECCCIPIPCTVIIDIPDRLCEQVDSAIDSRKPNLVILFARA
ncbi:uncharacterized protein PG998_004752 [Apiospora kogelbergensis]|uniref:uncharacterized protein n=1 Tax=Apiospora kogelbergensis TaxID=1337665 RepID=UPI00312F8331